MATLPGGGQQPLYGDGLGVNRCNCPLTEREDQFQIVNNWTKIIGNHSVKIGADLRYGRNLRVPSDNDRDGLLNFSSGPTSDPADTKAPGGLGFGTFLLGDVTSFNRYVSTTVNAKEFQKRTFFYAQDTWRVTHNLTLNLGVRWELYFPEAVNGVGFGALMNINDGYLHVAGIGGIPTDMGWQLNKKKQFEPRLGLTYQLDQKTVLRAGYGRSFDTGVFGSIFGHTVTQNLPVLANQQLNQASTTAAAFTLAAGPTAYTPPAVPSNGLLPNPGYAVDSKVRPNPLQFPTIDAWNLSVQRALTPTLTLTLAYVGNKGSHTLGDGDGNNTNPNEPAINLPPQYSVTGQTLHWDPTVPKNTVSANGGTSTGNFLSRYYGGTLPACSDPNYIGAAALSAAPYNEPLLGPGMCGWTNGIQYDGDNQNTEFDALQITLAQTFSKGLALNVNYQWDSAFDEQTGYYTWDHVDTHGRDSNTRDQQITGYGSYDLPFGKGKQYAAGVNHLTDLLIGGYQLSAVLDWSGGLPFTLAYNEAGTNLPTGSVVSNGSAPTYPSAMGGAHMKTSLTGTGTRTYYQAQTTNLLTDPGTGIFTDPGLDTIGNVGRNTYFGPGYFNTDLGLTKAFTIHENIAAKFRMDAFNAFNHINPGNPSGGIESAGTITAEAQGCGPGGQGCGPRQLEFSLRVQF
jgi:outer membrane receptor protein involved in Fe transport